MKLLPHPPAHLLVGLLAMLVGVAALLPLARPVTAEDGSSDSSKPPPKTTRITITPDRLSGWALPDATPPPEPPLSDQDRAKLYGFGDPDDGLGAFRLDQKPPANHTADFVRRHGVIARASTAECASCHREQECLDCHQGLVRPMTIHPPAYIEIHAQEAYRQSWSCTTCHTPQLFCRSCHTLARAGTQGPAAPPPGVRFHPEGWLGRVPGPDHGRQARRNLMACASCHQERDCVRCHAHINPHPSTFVATCGSLLKRNARACVRCHSNIAALQAVCR
ncbi:MAG: hypothetical protein AAFX99_00715 [Myxococcota bacterium]